LGVRCGWQLFVPVVSVWQDIIPQKYHKYGLGSGVSPPAQIVANNMAQNSGTPRNASMTLAHHLQRIGASFMASSLVPCRQGDPVPKETLAFDGSKVHCDENSHGDEPFVDAVDIPGVGGEFPNHISKPPNYLYLSISTPNWGVMRTREPRFCTNML